MHLFGLRKMSAELVAMHPCSHDCFSQWIMRDEPLASFWGCLFTVSFFHPFFRGRTEHPSGLSVGQAVGLLVNGGWADTSFNCALAWGSIVYQLLISKKVSVRSGKSFSEGLSDHVYHCRHYQVHFSGAATYYLPKLD